jgi:chromosome segregation ATPase
MGVEQGPQMPSLEKKEGDNEPKIDLVSAIEVLGGLDEIISALDADSTSFSTFVESIRNRITSIRKEISSNLTLSGTNQQNFKAEFENYVREVRSLEDLINEVDLTIKSLKQKTEQLGGTLGADKAFQE